jgi:hypothetical protein
VQLSPSFFSPSASQVYVDDATLIQEKWRESDFELAPIPTIAIAFLLQVAGCPACLGTNRLAGHHQLNPAVGLASRRIIV